VYPLWEILLNRRSPRIESKFSAPTVVVGVGTPGGPGVLYWVPSPAWSLHPTASGSGGIRVSFEIFSR
jgi:hypothetical protein